MARMHLALVLGFAVAVAATGPAWAQEIDKMTYGQTVIGPQTMIGPFAALGRSRVPASSR